MRSIRSRLCTRRIENAKPRLEVKSRRVGGATYQVPMEVSAGPPDRARDALDRRLRPEPQGYRRCAKRSRPNSRTPPTRAGNAIKKRDDTHKMAQANRAFAHFRF